MKPANIRWFSPLPIGLLVLALGIFSALGLSSCGGSGSQSGTTAAPATAQPLSAIAQLGKKIYFDQSLSASGKMACSTCHDPTQNYGPANNLVVQLGGPGLDQPGGRVAPQIAYDFRNPPFSIGPDTSSVKDAVSVAKAAASAGGTAIPQKVAGGTASAGALVPVGGLFWDGRVNTLQDQANGPLFNPVEMANPDVPTLAAKLAAASYAGDIGALFGPGIFSNSQLLVSEAEYAVARFEFEDPSFQSFNSKYDYYLAGKVQLSASEANGLQLFEDPAKGNCAACHLDKMTPDGLPPMLTDFQYEALGVPRNAAIPANANPAYYDLGLCGPTRTDLAAQTNYCGMFRTPSLRNVATRKYFFHNGKYSSLADVLQFYVYRDINPERFYPTAADGSVTKFDDLPPQYQANVDVTDAPFNHHPGDTPALSDSEIQDLTAFLNTLTDGYQPANAYQ